MPFVSIGRHAMPPRAEEFKWWTLWIVSNAASISSPERFAGDTAYGVVKLVTGPWDRGIIPHIPVWNRSARCYVKFSRTDFVFRRGAQRLTPKARQWHGQLLPN